MEHSIIEAVCSLGVGAVFGITAFFFYRRDRKASEDQLRQDRVFMEDRMDKIINRDQDSREKNTEALKEMTTVLKRMNGKNKG